MALTPFPSRRTDDHSGHRDTRRSTGGRRRIGATLAALVLALAMPLAGAIPAAAGPGPAAARALTVAAAPTASTISSVTTTATSITYGQYVILRFVLTSGGTPMAGAQTTVTYGGRTVPVPLDGNGRGALGVTNLPVGHAGMIIRYAGDATHGAASAIAWVTVAARPSVISSITTTATSITYGQYVILRYVLTSGGQPVAGARTFVTYGGKTRVVPLDANGRGAIGVTDLPVGRAGMLIRFGGDSTRSAASAIGWVTVAARPTAISGLNVSDSSIVQGDSTVVRYTLTSNGSPVPGARTAVTYGNTTTWVTVDGSGRGALNIPGLPVGKNSILVRYFGDTTRARSSATISVTVSPRANPCPATARACVDLTHNLTWLQSGGQIVYGPVPMTSGRPGYRTDAGTFRVYWKDKDHKSSIFDDAPMPNAIFFNGGDAFHQGSLSVPSHGCIHLSWSASQTYWDFLNYNDIVYVFGYAQY